MIGQTRQIHQCALALTLSAAVIPTAAGQHVYQTDDGVPDGQVISGSPEMLLLNYYTVESPHDTITQLVVGNAPTGFDSGELLIWDDPTDDGDPSDATLLFSTPFEAPVGGFELVRVDVAPTQVAGGFSVGVLVRAEGPRLWMDRTAPTGAAWILHGAGLNPADLSAIGPPGIEVNWFIRAVAGEAVCYADCDSSGGLDFFDFLCFQQAFALGEARADCDGSGELDLFDFLCFQAEFAAGCP